MPSMLRAAASELRARSATPRRDRTLSYAPSMADCPQTGLLDQRTKPRAEGSETGTDLVADHLGPLGAGRLLSSVSEGCAEYVARRDTFNYDEARKQWLAADEDFVHRRRDRTREFARASVR